MSDPFKNYNPELNAPGEYAEVITPSNDDDLTNYTRGIYVGASGDINLIMVTGDTPILFKEVPVGILWVRAKKVLADSTDADDLIAIW